MAVGKIQRVPIRDAFPHEAHNFTVWLENNIDALSDSLGFELTVEQREKSVGSFNVDLFCSDEHGRYVIIENQLERTDHNHLGQLMTYLVNLEANTAIWVATEIRPEHERVIDWLNEMTSEDMGFYAVQVEAIRIENSPYAPLFTVMAQPDEQTRQIGMAKKEHASQQTHLIAFWTNLLRLSEGKFEDFNHLTPGNRYYLSTRAGLAYIELSYNIFRDYYGGQIYFNRQKDENERIFDDLYQYRQQIENDMGFELDWLRLDNKRASRIRFIVDKPEGYDFNESETWDALHIRMINYMIPFSQVMRKYLKKLNVE